MAYNMAFNVAPLGTACGHGTTIVCQLSAEPRSIHHARATNFNSKQVSIVVSQALGNCACHVSLYPDNNRPGGVIQRLDTDTTGTCIFTNVAEYQSYGIY